MGQIIKYEDAFDHFLAQCVKKFIFLQRKYNFNGLRRISLEIWMTPTSRLSKSYNRHIN